MTGTCDDIISGAVRIYAVIVLISGYHIGFVVLSPLSPSVF